MNSVAWKPIDSEQMAWSNLTVESNGCRWRYGIDYDDATGEYRWIDEIELPDDVRLCRLEDEGAPYVEMSDVRVAAFHALIDQLGEDSMTAGVLRTMLSEIRGGQDDGK